MPVKKHEDEDYVVSGEEEESDEDIDLVQEEEEEDEVEEDEEDAPIAKKSKLSSRSTSKNAAKTKRQSKGDVKKEKEEQLASKRKKPAASSKPKAPPPPTEPTLMDDGFTVHPERLIHKSDPEAQGKTKIAGIDLDGTMILRKNPNGVGFQGPIDEHDWRWFNDAVSEKLKKLHDEGFGITIFTNQGSIQKAMLGANSTKIRRLINNVLQDLDKKNGCHVPVQVVMATGRDPCNFRKPRTGMWDFFVDNLNAGVAPDLEQSFYVGDAAGRADDINNGSDSDKQFAASVGIKFHLPEEFFGEKQETTCAEPSNAGLAASFSKMGKLLQDVKKDFMRGRAFLNVSIIITDWPTKITSSKDLKGVKGVGKSSMAKIDEFLATGKMEALEELKSLDPKAVNKVEMDKMAAAFL